MSRTIIVCGGRNGTGEASRKLLNEVLTSMHLEKPITLVKHGNAKGFDTWAARWAIENNIQQQAFNANWTKFGNAAGPIRNQQMADSGADECVAFPGGEGTADMVRRAKAAGMKVTEVKYYS